MGLISGRFRKKQEDYSQCPPHAEYPEPSPEPEPIRRYRVQSLPAMAAPVTGDRSVFTHRDNFEQVTKAWKRDSQIRILDSSENSTSSASMWSDPSLESQLVIKKGPVRRASVGLASPTFSICGSTHSDASTSPSLEYSASFSSQSSASSMRSSIVAKSEFISAEAPTTQLDAGIPPLLPAHRTFSGNPYHGSFRSKPKHRHTKSVASDFIPLHVFTREPRAVAPPPPLHAPPHSQLAMPKKRFTLDGYSGGLKVINITPPGSPLPFSDTPQRYRVPSKASLMDS